MIGMIMKVINNHITIIIVIINIILIITILQVLINILLKMKCLMLLVLVIIVDIVHHRHHQLLLSCLHQLMDGLHQVYINEMNQITLIPYLNNNNNSYNNNEDDDSIVTWIIIIILLILYRDNQLVNIISWILLFSIMLWFFALYEVID